MERRSEGVVRDDWNNLVEAEGLTYWKTWMPDGSLRCYWREGAHYRFSHAEVAQMYADQQLLFDMFVEAGDWLVRNPDYMRRMAIPEWTWDNIRKTWDRRDSAGNEVDWGSVYGRIDVVYGGNAMLDPRPTDLQDRVDPALGHIRLYEFNADTPTALVESAITQWSWFDQTRQGDDQWNGLFEALVDAWKRNLAYVEQELGYKPTIYFACTWHDNLLPEVAELIPADQRAIIDVEKCSYEDLQNIRLLQESCEKAGYPTKWIYVEQIHLGEDGRIYDGSQIGPTITKAHIDVIFKLYPWEHLVREEFGKAIFEDMERPGGTYWIEPPYKMLWSNKGLLAVLWKLFGDDPERSKLLIPTWFEGEQPDDLTDYVRKPLLGREGANVQVFEGGKLVIDSPGGYGEEGSVIQAYAPAPNFVGWDNGQSTDNYPTIGMWYVDGEPAGIIIRENDTTVVDNLSICVPHVIAD